MKQRSIMFYDLVCCLVFLWMTDGETDKKDHLLFSYI